MLIVIRLIARRLPADVARERPSAAMDLHMLGQVITPMERLTALGDLADVLLRRFVFLDVPLAVVLAYELAAAVVAGVGAHGLVRVHVRDVLGAADEGALAQRALEGLGGARHVRPAVQLQVPLGGEGLVAHHARERPLAAVRLQVRAQVAAEVDLEYEWNVLAVQYT